MILFYNRLFAKGKLAFGIFAQCLVPVTFHSIFVERSVIILTTSERSFEYGSLKSALVGCVFELFTKTT